MIEPVKVSFDEFLARVLDQMPDAEVLEDGDGQMVIYTGLKEIKTPDGKLEVVPMGD